MSWAVALILSITCWEIKGRPSMTSLLWVDHMIQTTKGKVVFQGMWGRPGVGEAEVAIDLSQSGRFDVRKPVGRGGMMSEVIPDGKDSRVVAEYMNGGLRGRVVKRVRVIIKDVSCYELHFSGEAIMTSKPKKG